MGAKDKAKKDDPKAEAAKAAAKKEKAENDLIKACKNDELSKAKKCVEAGADLSIDATGTGSTPLHVAAGFGSPERCVGARDGGRAWTGACAKRENSVQK